MSVTQEVSYSMLARNRAESLRWVADRHPERVFTREELYIMAREAESFAAEFSRLAAVEQNTGTERDK